MDIMTSLKQILKNQITILYGLPVKTTEFFESQVAAIKETEELLGISKTHTQPEPVDLDEIDPTKPYNPLDQPLAEVDGQEKRF